MWHEARKQEKKLRVMIVDYRKRAERRREFYEKFKADPTQFMQVHGRPSKIYLEPQIAASAENCMMPWQGNSDNMIDRFDVRAHLDIIPEWHSSSAPSYKSTAAEEEEVNPGINYERYRILIQHDLSGMSEDKFLHQIHLEEQFGTSATTHSHFMKNIQPKAPKAAIGYNYEDSTPAMTFTSTQKAAPVQQEAEEESEEEIDFDLLVNVDDLTHGQKAELNNYGTKYGLGIGDFMEYLNGDLEEKEKLRLAKLQEEEKQAMSGRKARRERRAYKDKLIMRKGYVSPPSYATFTSTSPSNNDPAERRSTSRSESRSRSNSPEKITFITSFGGNESDDGKGGNVRPLPFARDRASSSNAVFGPSLPSDKRHPEGDSKRHPPRRRQSSGDRSRSRSTVRRRNRSRSHSESNKRRRSSSRGRGRRRHSTPRRRRRHSSSSSSSRSRSTSRSRRRHRRSTSRSRSRSTSRSRRRRRHSSSRSRSHTRRRRSSRSRHRRSRFTPRSKSRGRRRNSKRSQSSSTTASSPAKSTRRKRSSSSSSPVFRKSKSTEPQNKSPKEKLETENSTEPVKESKEPSPPPVRRYYGRKTVEGRDRSSGSDSDEISLSENSDSGSDSRRNGSQNHSKRDGDGNPPKGKSGLSSASKEDCAASGSAAGSSKCSMSASSLAKLTPKERLRRKMQSALSKTFKADKEAEKQRQVKQVQERMEREESLRELTIKYRRRERERRHRDRERSSSSSSAYSRSRSRSHSPSVGSRSRSKSPYYF